MKGNSFLVVFFALLLWDTMRQGEGMGDGYLWSPIPFMHMSNGTELALLVLMVVEGSTLKSFQF